MCLIFARFLHLQGFLLPALQYLPLASLRGRMLDMKGHPTDFMSVPIALPLERISGYRALLSVKKSQERKCWHAVHVRYKYFLVVSGGLGDFRLTGDTMLSHASSLFFTTDYYSWGKTLKQSLPFKFWWPSRIQHGLGCWGIICRARGPRGYVAQSLLAMSLLHVQSWIISRIQWTQLDCCQ